MVLEVEARTPTLSQAKSGGPIDDPSDKILIFTKVKMTFEVKMTLEVLIRVYFFSGFKKDSGPTQVAIPIFDFKSSISISVTQDITALNLKLTMLMWKGKFATVRRCRHKETNVDYAAKCIRKRRRAQDVTHELLHEVAVLETSRDCSRIVQLHEVYDSANEMILVLEFAHGGELQRLLDVEERIPERDARKFMRHILEGVSYLHAKGIAHLDIKPQNILLMDDIPSRREIKLCDFGISRLIRKGNDIKEIMGTPDYVAPEVLNYEPLSLATDIWSLGVLAYVLLSGCSPFAGDNKQETFFNISQGMIEFPSEDFTGVSDSAKDFVISCLTLDPCSRPSIEGCLTHRWLSPSILRMSTPSSSPLLPRSARSSPRSCSPVICDQTPPSPPVIRASPRMVLRSSIPRDRDSSGNNKENKLHIPPHRISAPLLRPHSPHGAPQRKSPIVHIPKRRGTDQVEGGPLTKNVSLSPRLTRHAMESSRR
ncbi:unnamed protein product [Cyprideis torosa]|uniref:non-specific serine/threonine protein kinase n=1 Tax=Cyprideis torosa TaxID=163714 RepID=A0A7R8WAC3_9CRUS|nr:unnamed protein product [Cyprideis torosa]CAG0885159.1 unnamed protein product [Cyprideis torosa]